jgi:hypothetical protein
MMLLLLAAILSQNGPRVARRITRCLIVEFSSLRADSLVNRVAQPPV